MVVNFILITIPGHFNLHKDKKDALKRQKIYIHYN